MLCNKIQHPAHAVITFIPSMPHYRVFHSLHHARIYCSLTVLPTWFHGGLYQCGQGRYRVLPLFLLIKGTIKGTIKAIKDEQYLAMKIITHFLPALPNHAKITHTFPR